MNDTWDSIVVGAGPAGLSAARELSLRGRKVLVLEQRDGVGGLARTIERAGRRFDIGPHRFFTKSSEVQRIWEETLGEDFVDVERLTRILYRGRFFCYPLRILNTFAGLGPWGSLKAFASYCLRPRRSGDSYEDYISAAFGRVLYETFFRSYSEKVWGIPCSQISPDFASQRIAGLSFWGAVRNALVASRRGLPARVRTLVAAFQYPRGGSGMIYDRWADLVRSRGGTILTGREVAAWNLSPDGKRVESVDVAGPGGVEKIFGREFISTVPINELILSLEPHPPPEVSAAARALRFRDHISVNLAVRGPAPFPDQWIYLHDPALHAARAANYINFSPAMSGRPDEHTLTMEYFSFRDDRLWSSSDADLVALAERELRSQSLLASHEILDGFVVREPDAYPVYFLQYQPLLSAIRSYLGRIGNLHPAGRGGLYRYNNMDHSILTGIYAARNVLGGNHDVWSVNLEQEYLEQVREQDSY